MNSCPDLQYYQEEFSERHTKSLTIYDRSYTQDIKRKGKLVFDYSLAGLVQCNLKTIGGFFKKSFQQWKRKEKVSLTKNLVNAFKESDHHSLQLVEGIKEATIGSSRQSNKLLRPPAQMMQKAFTFIKNSLFSIKPKTALSQSQKNQSSSQGLHSAYHEDAIFDDIII